MIFLFRKKRQDANSIEHVFEPIIKELSGHNKNIKSYYLPYDGSSISTLWNNIKFTRNLPDKLLHITGETHYCAVYSNKKIILTIHDSYSALNKGLVHNFIVALFWFWLPALYAKKITTISNQSAEEVKRLIPFAKKKIVVIPNPVNPEIVYTPKQFNKQFPIILLIGTKPNKNLERTIEAVSTIKCQLIIIGRLSPNQTNLLHQHNFKEISPDSPQTILSPNPQNPPQQSSINNQQSAISNQQSAINNHKSSLNNYQSSIINLYNLPYSQIIELYRLCDLVCFASTYEGFGMPIIEAQATGRPVVTSNISSMPEVAGDAACLVDPYSVGSIREGIMKVIHDNDYRETLVQKGLENIKRFEAKKIAEQYMALYMKIIHNDPE